MSKIIGESFDPYVKEQIKVRQTKLGLNQSNDDVNRYLTSRQSWIRLTSGVNVDEGKCLEIGIPTKYQGNQLASNYILFNGVNSRENISVPKGGIIDAWGNDSLLTSNQYGFNSSQEQGLVPMPFVESIKVTPKNRGSLRIAEIKMKCFNKQQFDIIETLYMRIKYTLLLEWGHTMYFNNEGGLISNPNGIYEDFLDLTPIPEPPLLPGQFLPILPDANTIKIQNLIQRVRQNSNGNYDAFMGWVQNFKWNLNPDYSYDISLKAVTYGDIIESLSITSPVTQQPLEGEDQGKNSSPLGRTLKYIKNYLDNQETSDPLTANKIDEIAKLGNTPYITPNEDSYVGAGDALKIDKSFLGFGPEVYYIKLGTLIRMIESFFYKYDNISNPTNPLPLNFFDTDPKTNFCNIIPNLFSLDPRICIIESDTNITYRELVTYGNSIRTVDRSVTLTELAKTYGFKGFLNKKHESGKNVGQSLNIYLNIDMILEVLDKNVDQNGNLPVFDFFKSIFTNVNKALGGITDLNFSYNEDTNTYFVIDSNLIQQADLFPDSNGEEAAMINVGLITSNQGSFVLDTSIESTISNQMGNMLAIGAQSNNQDVGSNSIAISRWNTGLTDRVIPSKLTTDISTSGEEGLKEGDKNELGELLNKYIVFNLDDSEISKLYTVGKNFFIVERDIAVKKDELQANFFIPLSLNLTLDGISGPKIYQKYTINDELLPRNYRDNIDFLIKGISHTVDSKGWTTSLESIGTPKPRQLKPKTQPKNTSWKGSPYASGRPAITPTPQPADTSTTPNANRLRNVLSQLGYTEKGDEIANAGDITAGMADYAIAVFREIKRRNPAISVRVTGGNDIYHTNLSYVSSHSLGEGLDFTITPATPANLKTIEDILKQFAAGNRGVQASYINEYKNATIASTGKHFHLRINGIDGGARQNIENIYRLADQGQINPLPIA